MGAQLAQHWAQQAGTTLTDTEVAHTCSVRPLRAIDIWDDGSKSWGKVRRGLEGDDVDRNKGEE